MSSGRPRAVSNMLFFVSWHIDVVNKQLFSQDISPVNDLKTCYTDVKTTESVKKKTVSKRMADFKSK